MDKRNWLEAVAEQTQAEIFLETNQYTQRYGLTLSSEDAQIIAAERRNTLKEHKRVEFGESIMSRLIYEFCDSCYISQDNYLETMLRLQEIFFLYKNEMLDEISDEELLHFMKEQFETICEGDLDYLAGTCLSIFAQAVRAGYRGYEASGGKGVYGQFDEVPRWDRKLYQEALKELFWG